MAPSSANGAQPRDPEPQPGATTGAQTGGKRIRAVAANDRIIADAAGQRVVAIPAVQQVIAG
jgi:hypothetical protein